jgi:GNAT superfamily N-acetyltransferase
MSGDFGEQARAVTTRIRDAVVADLPRVLELYVALGVISAEEQAGTMPSPAHERAFADVCADPRQRLLVIEADGRIAGTLVLLIVPNISRGGRPYALVENVVVDEGQRGSGYGAELMRYAIAEARRAGCYKIALTSRDEREDAHRFYEGLGFVAASKGFRLPLE